MTKFEMFKGNDNQHYFRLKSEDGKVLLSSEAYSQKDNATKGIESVKRNIAIAERLEKKQSEVGKHFFNVKSTNGQVVGTSAQFDTPELRDQWIEKLRKATPQAQVIEVA